MPLYEKFGLSAELFKKEEFEFFNKMIQIYLHKKTSDTYQFRSYKQSLIDDSSHICFDYYMIDEKEKIEHYVKPMLEYAIDYFFGEWRKANPIDGKIGEDFLKKGESWIREFRASILWGTYIGEWEKVKEISKYPDDLSMLENLESKEMRAWYTALAIFLREGTLKNADKYIEIIEAGKKKREKLLINVLRSIVEKDLEKFNKEFRVYLKYYKAHECKGIHDKLAIDGTILFNIAKHNGMPVEFPKEYIDHYIFLE
jgi:hypothetical protein